MVRLNKDETRYGILWECPTAHFISFTSRDLVGTDTLVHPYIKSAKGTLPILLPLELFSADSVCGISAIETFVKGLLNDGGAVGLIVLSPFEQWLC